MTTRKKSAASVSREDVPGLGYVSEPHEAMRTYVFPLSDRQAEVLCQDIRILPVSDLIECILRVSEDIFRVSGVNELSVHGDAALPRIEVMAWPNRVLDLERIRKVIIEHLRKLVKAGALGNA